ncbi:eEF1A lysine and N-terminal methyltransferase homolog isoform X2 [Phymastichus coffea]|uniref:eEF1A lysine and N-terminal methyltransferase homolog isoform X2 n=1 Tax=Phymastichus coffea TaxID=108790 RepID=UPI00273BB962|nr:eEF1A lysine and N-terminal methyltransferase homolog isoform X2 [Phymastichus coffea]
MTTLLPKSHQEFSKANYWNTFFKKRGKKTFEWYGEFPDLSSHLLKYIKPNDNVVIVGCGNSTLGMDLYDNNYKNIINIDLSQVVIKQMLEMNKVKRPDLIFEAMDATKMTYSDGKFSVVLDKGTLDALMSDTNESTIASTTKYLNEIKRVLKNNGRYICISLLQEHILKTIIENCSSNCAIRAIRCHETELKAKEQDESPMPVFMIVEIVLTDGPLVRLSNPEELINSIISIQESASLCNNLYKSCVANEGEVSLDLYKPGDKEPRYTVYILDQLLTKERKTYACFIVPQGREMDWLFRTKEGRQQLSKSVQYDRLAIVILRRGQIFENLNTVKKELADSIKSFAPAALKNQIPFLSLGKDIGTRKILYEGNSNISGPFVIEENETENGVYRRLVFLNNQFVIQSEAKLKQVTTRRKKSKYIVDPHFVACDHHLYMTVGLKTALQTNDNGEIVIIGLGGGGLCTFIRQYMSRANITAVEIDPTIFKVATDYFDLVLDDKLKVEITDGTVYLQNSAKEGKKFDAILFDVDNKDPSVGMSCPPKVFIEPAFLKTVETCLSDNGLFILNLVARNETLRNEVISDLKKIYKFVATYKLLDDVNEIVFCAKNEKDFKEWRNSVAESAKSINSQVKAKKPEADNFFEITSLLSNLSIAS